MPYWGDPQSLLVFNENIESLPTDPTAFETAVAAYDAQVTPIMTAELGKVFYPNTLPAKNSENDSVLSALWLMRMTVEIQRAKLSTNLAAGESNLATMKMADYKELMTSILAGTVVVSGARRYNSVPRTSNSTPVRLKSTSYSSPQDLEILNLFKKGLRF